MAVRMKEAMPCEFLPSNRPNLTKQLPEVYLPVYFAWTSVQQERRVLLQCDMGDFRRGSCECGSKGGVNLGGWKGLRTSKTTVRL